MRPLRSSESGAFPPNYIVPRMRFSSFLVVLQKGMSFSCLQRGPGFESGKSHPGHTLRSRRNDQKSRKDESKRSMRPEGCRGQLAEFRPLVLEGWPERQNQRKDHFKSPESSREPNALDGPWTRSRQTGWPRASGSESPKSQTSTVTPRSRH